MTVKYLPAFLSRRTTSETSNSFNGSGIFLFAARVLSSPGTSVVLATWNSRVFGLEIWTAGIAFMSFPSFAATSSLEHCVQKT